MSQQPSKRSSRKPKSSSSKKASGSVRQEVKKEAKAVAKAVEKDVKSANTSRRPRARQPRSSSSRQGQGAGRTKSVASRELSIAQDHARGGSVRTGSRGEFATLVRAFVDPQRADGARVPDKYTSCETASLCPFISVPIPYSSTVDSGWNFMDVSQSFLATTRSPLVAYIYYVANCAAGSYQAQFRNQDDAPVPTVGMELNDEFTPWPVGFFTAVSGAVFGPILPCAAYQPRDTNRYILMQVGDAFTITITDDSDKLSGVKVKMLTWNFMQGPAIVDVGVIAVNTSVDIYPLGNSPDSPAPLMYVALQFQGVPMSLDDEPFYVVTLNVVYSFQASGRFVTAMAPSLSGVIGTMTAIRPIGRSVLFQNTSSSLNAEGSVVGCQLGTGDHWTKYITPTPTVGTAPPLGPGQGFAGLTSLEQSTQMLAKTGMYMWAIPTDDKFDEWRTDFTVASGQLLDTYYPILDAGYQLMIANIPVTDSVTQSGNWIIASSNEGQTTDTTREQCVSKLTAAHMLRLQDVLKTMKQYSENPFHFSDILSNIKKAVSGVTGAIGKYGPMALDAAELIGGLI